MNRIKQIFDILNTLAGKRFIQSLKMIEDHCASFGDIIAAGIISKFRDAFVKTTDLQEHERKGAVRYLVLSHLYSAVCTGGYSIKLDIFDQRLYADPHEINVYLRLDWLYNYLEEDMAYFRKELIKTHITGLREYEMEQIRYRYIYYYHAAVKTFISESMPILLRLPEFVMLNVESEFEVLFGGYMDKAVVIWPKTLE